jgi:hypothetical protein
MISENYQSLIESEPSLKATTLALMAEEILLRRRSA